MSRPKYGWWSYAQSMIRKYPERAKRADGLSAIERKELEAVQGAIHDLRRAGNSAERLQIIELVYWKQRRTLAGAAMELSYSYRTVKRWHSEFVYGVAAHFGLLEA